ncbi:ATP synthase F0 [Coniochaeta sp. PMI_546]|nr:ATP synthase F0 [Coniochaeta sp. PMI_546]
MDRLANINPFAKRDSHSRGSVITYKILTIVTWLLSVIVSVYYTFDYPRHGRYHHLRSIWDVNYAYPTGFTLNYLIVSLYWLTIFILQIGYIGHLFSSNVETVNAACAVGSHFIVNNLLHFGFVWLFVSGHFAWAEVLLILNFVNLSSLYFRHNAYPRFIHTPAVSGPLAWTFVAIYWNGAIMVHHPASLVARIFANIFVWSILAYGSFFIIVYRDYTMGFSLSVLSAALGVAQFHRQTIAFQWIFAFTIMAVLFVLTVIVAVPVALGRDLPFGRRQTSDTERAPLLADN